MKNSFFIAFIATVIGSTCALAEPFPVTLSSYNFMGNRVAPFVAVTQPIENIGTFDAYAPRNFALNAAQVQQIFSLRDKYLNSKTSSVGFDSSFLGLKEASWAGQFPLETSPLSFDGFGKLEVALNAAQVQQILSLRDKYLVK